MSQSKMIRKLMKLNKASRSRITVGLIMRHQMRTLISKMMTLIWKTMTLIWKMMTRKKPKRIGLTKILKVMNLMQKIKWRRKAQKTA